MYFMGNEGYNSEDSTTLFLGDLSVFCTEKDIRKLFRSFGPIEAIRVKRGSSSKTNLSYGFIKFIDRASAEQAFIQLNGVMFLGRALRIGWAEGKGSCKPVREELLAPKKGDTAQIHVSFISKQVDMLISEATLRSLFSMYGEVVDVALKKSQFDKNLRVQNGYGFVHYAFDPDGIRAALTAVQCLHQVTIDRVTYDCSISHALQHYLMMANDPSLIPAGSSYQSLLNSSRPTHTFDELPTYISTTPAAMCNRPNPPQSYPSFPPQADYQAANMHAYRPNPQYNSPHDAVYKVNGPPAMRYPRPMMNGMNGYEANPYDRAHGFSQPSAPYEADMRGAIPIHYGASRGPAQYPMAGVPYSCNMSVATSQSAGNGYSRPSSAMSSLSSFTHGSSMGHYREAEVHMFPPPAQMPGQMNSFSFPKDMPAVMQDAAYPMPSRAPAPSLHASSKDSTGFPISLSMDNEYYMKNMSMSSAQSEHNTPRVRPVPFSQSTSIFSEREVEQLGNSLHTVRLYDYNAEETKSRSPNSNSSGIGGQTHDSFAQESDKVFLPVSRAGHSRSNYSVSTVSESHFECLAAASNDNVTESAFKLDYERDGPLSSQHGLLLD